MQLAGVVSHRSRPVGEDRENAHQVEHRGDEWKERGHLLVRGFAPQPVGVARLFLGNPEHPIEVVPVGAVPSRDLAVVGWTTHMAAPVSVSVPAWKLPKWLNALMRAMVRWLQVTPLVSPDLKMADQERALYPAEPPTRRGVTLPRSRRLQSP